MKKYRKNTVIEVVEYLANGDVYVQNENDDTDRWVIPKETFLSTYDEVEQEV